MIVSINTQTLNEMASGSMSISSELAAAFECLSPVVLHNDWNCYERDTINEMIAKIKHISNELKNSAESFASTLQQAKTSFDEYEKQEPSSIKGAQAAFTDVLSENTPTTVVNNITSRDGFEKMPSDFPGRFVTGLPNPSWPPIKVFQTETILKPIPVVKPFEKPLDLFTIKDGYMQWCGPNNSDGRGSIYPDTLLDNIPEELRDSISFDILKGINLIKYLKG